MTAARLPWLSGAHGTQVPYVASLRRADRIVDGAAPSPWRTSPAAAASAAGPDLAEGGPSLAGSVPRCSGCADLALLRDNLATVRTAAVEEGRAAGLAETAALRERLIAAVAAIDQARVTRDDALTEQVVDLALGLCAELAPAAAAIDRRGLVQLVARSLADAGGDRELKLQVCAEDAAAIGTQLPAGMICTVRPELVPGEVWVEAPRLVVDGRWTTRLAALREPLLALVRAAEPAFELARPSGHRE